MINAFAKSLVLLHAVLCIAGMSYGMMVFFTGRDFGWIEPRAEVLEYNPDNTPKQGATFHRASEYDKSVAALKAAAKTRDLTYTHVQPAIDSIKKTEPYLYQNHLYYVAQLKRLRDAEDKIAVHRLAKGGNDFDTPLGTPKYEANAIPTVTKSYKSYQGDLKTLFDDIDKVEADIRTIVNDTKQITADLTGTDETNKYVQPGLYKLVDLEYKAQTEYKKEIDDIKPNWSKAVEQARLLLIRRADLEASLEKLKGPPPANKNGKKI